MKIFYCRDTNLPEFFICGNLISEDGFVHCRRNFDCNVLIFVLEGTLHITQAERPFSVSAGQYVFLRAGEEHYGHKAADGKLSYMWVHFRNSAPWETAPDNGKGLPPGTFSCLLPECAAAASPQRVRLLFQQLMGFSRQEQLYTETMLSCSLSLLLMELTQEYLDGGKGRQASVSPAVSAAAEWARSNCHRQITIHDIAGAIHYNAEYLSALFKKETGLSLLQYLNRTRIELSKSLLAGNAISVKETAYSCGFTDEKYFMKIFKRLEGVTPCQYKNAFHKKA